MTNVLQRQVWIWNAVAALFFFSCASQAQTFEDIYSFTVGLAPYGRLVRDSKGNLYGTTMLGGAHGGGTVFKVDLNGTGTVLSDFCPHNHCNGRDGVYPYAGLVRDSSGNLYGTTSGGGFSDHGLVFKVDPKGKFTVLHRFTGPDGCDPRGDLIFDHSGNLYGTTYSCGGGSHHAGTVWKLSPTGKETVLLTFSRLHPENGLHPIGGVVMDGKGNLYGTTYAGGTSNFGSVFKLDTAGKETVLHSFTCGDDGCFIYGTPAMDAEGNLYGTAVAGGSMSDGTAWKVTPQGVFTVLYSFAGDPDGSGPGANVIIDAEGNIYGDTTQGGISNDGTVFKLDHRGTETILHSFNGSDGSTPWGGPIRDASGTLFGTTQGGGTEGNGTVWKITP